MAIPTSRTDQKAEIRIDFERCTNCGLCASVCKDFSLIIENNELKISDNPLFGCVGCGHCMAVCPAGAIEIHGRTLSPDHLFALPAWEKAANYEQLSTLFERRRSIREFKETEVEAGKVEKIIAAAKTAPMGVPPSDVNVLVLDNQVKNRAFAKDFCEYLEGMK